MEEANSILKAKWHKEIYKELEKLIKGIVTKVWSTVVFLVHSIWLTDLDSTKLYTEGKIYFIDSSKAENARNFEMLYLEKCHYYPIIVKYVLGFRLEKACRIISLIMKGFNIQFKTSECIIPK